MFDKLKKIAELLKKFKGLDFKAPGGIIAMIIQLVMQDPAAALAFIKMIIALFSGKESDSADIWSPVVTFQSISPDEMRSTFGKVQSEYAEYGNVQDGLAYLMTNFEEIKGQINGVINIVRFWTLAVSEFAK